MFNTIKSQEKCPKCGANIDEWQSKKLKIKGYLIDNLLYSVTLDVDMNGEMHSLCDKCGTYIVYAIKKGKVIKN